MITAAIWCAAVAVYGLYCQNPMTVSSNDWCSRPSGERMRLAAVGIGVLSIFAAAILATIAVNS